MMVVCNGVVFDSRDEAKRYFNAMTFSAIMALYVEPYDEKKHLKLFKRQTRKARKAKEKRALPPISKRAASYSGEWLKIRAQILKVDNYECRICREQTDLHVHHIDKNRSNNKKSNLVTLCAACHRGVHASNYINGEDAFDAGSAWDELRHRESASIE